MESECVPQTAGRFDGQMFTEGPVAMGAVVVLPELNFRGVRVVGLHEPIHEAGVIALIFGRCDPQVALARVEVVGQQDVAAPFSYVFLMFFLGGPWLRWPLAQVESA